MHVSLDQPLIIDNTRKSDWDYPKEAFFMPVNCSGSMSKNQLQAACTKWLDNVKLCEVYAIFDDHREVEPVEIAYKLGCDQDGNPMIAPDYPKDIADPGFVGWQVHTHYNKMWTIEGYDVCL